MQARKQASKQASQQASEQASKQATKQVSKQASKQTSKRASKRASNRGSEQASEQASKLLGRGELTTICSKFGWRELSKQINNMWSHARPEINKQLKKQTSKQTNEQTSEQPNARTNSFSRFLFDQHLRTLAPFPNPGAKCHHRIPGRSKPNNCKIIKRMMKKNNAKQII